MAYFDLSPTFCDLLGLIKLLLLYRPGSIWIKKLKVPLKVNTKYLKLFLFKSSLVITDWFMKQTCLVFNLMFLEQF